MSSLGEVFVRLAGRLGTGRVSDEEFFAAFATSRAEVVGLGLGVLQAAVSTHDPVLVELGLYIGYRFGFADAHLAVLIDLAGEKWHTAHENVVGGLVRLRSPSSVDVLYKVALARFEYLDYDEAFALGVKCIWALGSIGSEAAVVRLGQLLECGNPVLEENARGQLVRIEKEGDGSAIRAAARRLLDAARR